MNMARFGKTIVLQSNWPEAEFIKMQHQLVDQYPKVVSEINQLVTEIAQLVRELPAGQLLHRAWGEMAAKHVKIISESEQGAEEILSIRMIDYIQSVVASIEPSATQRQDITEAEWQMLNDKVAKLFETIGFIYQICHRASQRAADPNLNEDFEEFKFKAQFYWCNIRGRRHQVHEPMYLKDMFVPHSEVLQELFGITSEEFVEGITKIWHSLTFGIVEATKSFMHFQSDVLNEISAKIGIESVASKSDLSALAADVVREKGWENRKAGVYGQFLGMDLFDVQMTSALPERLLQELTWLPGQDKEFFAAGEFCGWPLRIWPIFKRPFIRLNDHYYCFDLFGLFDNLYRVMQRIILRLKPSYQETWNTIQQELSENLPIKYLQRILPGASVWQAVYYKWQAGSGKQQWYECDGLLVYDDHLFIIECRGGAFTYTPPASDFPAYVDSIKNLVLKPATQGSRFLEFLNSADAVPIYDKQHQQVGELHRAAFRRVTICPVTLDPFTELAAQVQHLSKIGVSVGTNPVWVISLDDLRVYADIFENPLIFLHFVEQRMMAFQSDIIRVEDELDHLGLYLEHNCYTLHSEKMRASPDARVVFNGYRFAMDKFFAARLHDPATQCPLKQQTPHRLLEIVEFLAYSNIAGRARIVGFLLDLSGEWRDILSSNIEEELVRQPSTHRPKPFSSHGGMDFTIFCWTPSSMPRYADQALAHARTVLLGNGDQSRILFELVYTADNILQDVSWQWVDRAGIPLPLLPKLEAAAGELRQTRVAKAKESGVGRNDPCPCGSSKKYKKCCLRRKS